ncbi:DUF3515 domain-containing protein [Dietzia sp.]|uniref:DUF3515 domain-containing protein n=1 Tax=Dietzia sp. TaxID=1871616 RepID=UPI002FDAF619
MSDESSRTTPEDTREPESPEQASDAGANENTRTPRRESLREADPMRRSPWAIAAAIIIPLVLLAGVLVGANKVLRDNGVSQDDPISAGEFPGTNADAPECTDLLDAFPDSLGDAKQVDFSAPAPAGAAGFRMSDGSEVVVRCGVPAPGGFVVGAALTEVNGVQWFNEPDPAADAQDSTWVAVDRKVFVAVTLPENSGTGPIQALSDTITGTLPAIEPAPAPAGAAGPSAPR